MKTIFKTLGLMAMLGTAMFGQQRVDNSKALSVIPWPQVVDLPGRCEPGAVVSIKTMQTGSNSYQCDKDGKTWYQMTGNGSGIVVPSSPNVFHGDGAGGLQIVTGNASDCVHVDGTSGPCTSVSIPNTTNVLKGNNAGGATPVTGTGTDCVFVNGTSGPCPGGAGNITSVSGTNGINVSPSTGDVVVSIDPTILPRKTASETITGSWFFAAGLVLKPYTGTPLAADCNESTEFGSVAYQADGAPGGKFWICGSAGWEKPGGSGTGTGDMISNSTTSVANQLFVALTTDGKQFKPLTISGVPKLTNGVPTAITSSNPSTDMVHPDGTAGPVSVSINSYYENLQACNVPAGNTIGTGGTGWQLPGTAVNKPGWESYTPNSTGWTAAGDGPANCYWQFLFSATDDKYVFARHQLPHGFVNTQPVTVGYALFSTTAVAQDFRASYACFSGTASPGYATAIPLASFTNFDTYTGTPVANAFMQRSFTLDLSGNSSCNSDGILWIMYRRAANIGSGTLGVLKSYMIAKYQ